MTSILSSLHYLKAAQYFLSYAESQASGSVKNRFAGYNKRIDFIMADIGSQLKSEKTRQDYRDIISKADSVGLTNIIDGFHGLNDQQKEVVEHIVNALNSGEEITFEKDIKEPRY